MPGMKKVWWYGYGESFARQMEGFLDFQFARGLGERACAAVARGRSRETQAVVSCE